MTEVKVENLYYLGPDGSNAQSAMFKAVDLCKINAVNKIPKKAIKAVLNSVEQDISSFCVLPIENSIEGIVRETIDNLFKISDNTIRIQGEISLPIRHVLLSKSNDKSKIKKIISHPQALAQYSKYLYKNFPDIEIGDVSSTSYAAQKAAMSEDGSLAAIANIACADLFCLNIIDNDLNDEKDNQTRFYILGRQSLTKKQNGKTSIILSTKNHSGALCDVLKIFAEYDINLTYIDSRPSKKKLGEYLFFMEFDGLEDEPKNKTALEKLKKYVDFIRNLGSYSVYS